jgi:hypothetical protein
MNYRYGYENPPAIVVSVKTIVAGTALSETFVANGR